jgi:glycerophosphoryl diester phosphodiesterase
VPAFTTANDARLREPAVALSKIQHMDIASPRVVAHRGNAAEFPENTLEALQSAVDLGVRHVELDVQLCADHVPLLLHDADFRRMNGRADSVYDRPWAEIEQLSMGEPARFGDRYAAVRPASLAQLAAALARWPGVTAFVEIKRASLRRFGQDVVLGRMLECLAGVLERCVMISFDRPCLEALRRSGLARTGWVLGDFDEEARAQAAALDPEYLFCDLEKLPAGDSALWPGRWEWAIYEVRAAATARACHARGARYVETMTVRALLAELAGTAAP